MGLWFIPGGLIFSFKAKFSFVYQLTLTQDHESPKLDSRSFRDAE